MEKNGSSGEAQSGLQCGYSAGFLQTIRDLAEKQVLKTRKKMYSKKIIGESYGFVRKGRDIEGT